MARPRPGVDKKGRIPFMITSSHQQCVGKVNSDRLSMGSGQNPNIRCLRIEEALVYAGLSRSALYRLISQKKVVVRKAGSASLIEKESLDRYLDDLPGFKSRTQQPA